MNFSVRMSLEKEKDMSAELELHVQRLTELVRNGLGSRLRHNPPNPIYTKGSETFFIDNYLIY
jgi:hypothetical protein